MMMAVLPQLRKINPCTLSLFITSVLFCFCTQSAIGEVMYWRFPGYSGRWLDPHNWIGATSGLPRVPGPNDDVIIGGDYTFTYGGHYIVSLESRTDITVKSLRLRTQSSAPCYQTFSFYNYNLTSTMWEQIDLDYYPVGYTGIALMLVPPTKLIVTNTLTTDFSAQVQFVSLPSQPDLRSALSAGTWDFSGNAYGAGNLYGDLVDFKGGSAMDLVRLVYPSGSLPASKQDWPSTMTIYGDFQTQGGLSFIVDFQYGVYSVLDVKGNVDLPATASVFTSGSVAGDPPTFPLINFYNSTTGPPTFVYVYPYRQTPYWYPCGYNLPSTTSFGQQCAPASSNSFGSLLDTRTYSRSCCPEGLTGINCDIPYCPGIPVCNSRGTCRNGICVCASGWTGFACELPSCPGSPRECSGNGECYAPLPLGSAKPYCKCRQGWGDADCGTPLCPNNCTSPIHGTCNTQGNSPKCICNAGYQLGPDLDCYYRIPTCPGRNAECSGHGVCSNANCTCYPGWEGADCSLPVCPGGCNHHGVCVLDTSTNGTKCQCDASWSGSDCSTPSCNGGTGCNGARGYCSPDLDPPRCICNGPTVLPTSQPPSPAAAADSGWSGPGCQTSFPPACAATNCVANGGTCGDETKGLSCLRTSCPPGFSGWDCSEHICENSGYPECNGHGNCKLIGGSPVCMCRQGFNNGTDGACQFANCELYGCSGHGTCRTDLATPTCECEPYFYGPDCSIATCPGYPVACRGPTYGECTTNGTCQCTSMWQGGDCSVPVCPTTNGINCNQNGFCNSSSVPFFCQCYDGWSGTSCEKATCPNDCSGHGYCDASLSPPACRCDPFYVGDDCHSASSTGGTDSQDIMSIIIGATVAAMITAIVGGAAVGLVVYVIYRIIKAKQYRDTLASHTTATVNY